MSANRQRNKKVCVVCGRKFESPPSAGTKTCSPECRAEYKGQLMMTSESYADARDGFLQSRASYIATHSGEAHFNAKSWMLRSPAGKVYEVINLHSWVKTSGLFDDPNRAYAELIHVKQSLCGKRTRNPVYHYKGWSLDGWGIGNTSGSPQKVCKVCGAPLSSMQRSYCSLRCRNISRAETARQKYHAAELAAKEE